MNPLLALAEKWRSDAAVLRTRGAASQADLLQSTAAELEETWRCFQFEEMTLSEAADESGYTRSALEKMLQRGDLRNAGKPSKPRVLRCDLPRKPGGRQDEGPDIATEVLLATLGVR